MDSIDEHADETPAAESRSPLLTFTAFLMFLIIFLTFLQVLLRYAFNHPITWIEEASRYLFVWIVMLGSAIAFRLDAHIKVDMIDAYAGPRWARALYIARAATSVAAISLVLYSGVLVAWRNRAVSSYTMPDFPAVVFYLSVPVAAALMLVFILMNIWRAIKTR